MTRHLVRKCPTCKNEIKIKQVDGKIVQIIGAYQTTLGRGRRPSYKYTMNKGVLSQKQIRCSEMNVQKLSGLRRCSTLMNVSSFKEVQI